jgi:hypothetical protein
MGTDISGWIEARHPRAESKWFGVAPIRQLVDRNYWAFAALFGVRQSGDLGPLAPACGLPPDLAERTQSDHQACVTKWPDEYFGESWITWAEIAAVDWRAPVGVLVLTTNTDSADNPSWFT